MSTLGELDERNAFKRGAMDRAEGKAMNPHWLGRRVGVADAYRAGYTADPSRIAAQDDPRGEADR